MPRFVPIALADQIRARYYRDLPGCGLRATARQLGVSRATVQRIVRGKWRGGEREPRLERRRPSDELEIGVHVFGAD